MSANVEARHYLSVIDTKLCLEIRLEIVLTASSDDVAS